MTAAERILELADGYGMACYREGFGTTGASAARAALLAEVERVCGAAENTMKRIREVEGLGYDVHPSLRTCADKIEAALSPQEGAHDGR